MEASFPPGVANVVPGYGETAGAALAEHMEGAKPLSGDERLTGEGMDKGYCVPPPSSPT